MDKPMEAPKSVTAPNDQSPDEPLRFQSEALLQGRKEILIVHKQEIYRLRVTKNDKLILQK